MSKVAQTKTQFRPNTLEHIQQEISKDLVNGRPILVFKDRDELQGYLSVHFLQMVKHGQVSYDPIDGEVIVSFAPMDVFATLQDGGRIGEEIKTFFVEEGWDDAAVIPHRTGVSKTLVSLRSKSLKSFELNNPVKKIDSAIDSVLKKAK